MGARHAIILVVLAGLLGGCGSASGRPWRRKKVPITPPTIGKPYAAAQSTSTAPERPGSRPAATAPAVAVAPKPAEPVKLVKLSTEGPIPLTDLIYTEKAPSTKPATRPAETRPAATQPPAEPETTKPATTAPSKPPEPEKPPPKKPDLPAPAPKKVKKPAQNEVVTGSALQVNDQFLTVEELLRSAGPRIAALPDDLKPAIYRRRVQRILDEEINRRIGHMLVYSEATKRLTDQQKKRIDADMESLLTEMIANAGGSRGKLQARLARGGTTLRDVLADQRRQLTVHVYLQVKFYPAIAINRRMLWNYYRKHRDAFRSAKKVQMQIIAVPVKLFYPSRTARPSTMEREAAKRAARKLILQAAKDMKDGKKFALVAKQTADRIRAACGTPWKKLPKGFEKVCVDRMSEAKGAWSPMQAGSFIETKVETVAFALQEGSASDVIETPRGYYIVKAAKVFPGKDVSFENAQEEIEQILRQQQYEKLRDDYFQRLLKGAMILRTDRFMRLALERAVSRYYRK